MKGTKIINMVVLLIWVLSETCAYGLAVTAKRNLMALDFEGMIESTYTAWLYGPVLTGISWLCVMWLVVQLIVWGLRKNI